METKKPAICKRSLPCIVNIFVLTGLEQPCEHCPSQRIEEARDAFGWHRHPATHGEFYTSDAIAIGQQRVIEHRIGQANIENWMNAEKP